MNNYTKDLNEADDNECKGDQPELQNDENDENDDEIFNSNRLF